MSAFEPVPTFGWHAEGDCKMNNIDRHLTEIILEGEYYKIMSTVHNTARRNFHLKATFFSLPIVKLPFVCYRYECSVLGSKGDPTQGLLCWRAFQNRRADWRKTGQHDIPNSRWLSRSVQGDEKQISERHCCQATRAQQRGTLCGAEGLRHLGGKKVCVRAQSSISALFSPVGKHNVHIRDTRGASVYCQLV